MVGVAAGVRKGCKTTSIHSHRYMYSRAEECSVAVLMACACSVAVQWKQPDDHSSEHDKPVMPPCPKMLAMLCSSDTEGDLVLVFLTQFATEESRFVCQCCVVVSSGFLRFEVSDDLLLCSSQVVESSFAAV